MLAGIRFLRRIGLAAGTWFFVFFLARYLASWVNTSAVNGEVLMMATGAAILAFFLPRVEASSFESKEK